LVPSGDLLIQSYSEVFPFGPTNMNLTLERWILIFLFLLFVCCLFVFFLNLNHLKNKLFIHRLIDWLIRLYVLFDQKISELYTWGPFGYL
jgi:hypothetical protein